MVSLKGRKVIGSHLDTSLTRITFIAPKAPLFQRPKVSNGSCLFVRCPSQILVIFAGTDCTGDTPFPARVISTWIFRNPWKWRKNFDFTFCRVIPTDPVLGPFLITFFWKSSVFPSKGETTFRQPSAQPCPAGQSSTKVASSSCTLSFERYIYFHFAFSNTFSHICCEIAN